MGGPEHPVRLRPHHILCIRFFDMEPGDRGEAFMRAYRDTIAMLTMDEGTVIEVACGPDDLCGPCTYLGQGRCVSPFGDEDKVRRWDARVMDGLGLSYGERKTSGEIRRLIGQRAPLDFCTGRCPWKPVCTVPGQ